MTLTKNQIVEKIRKTFQGQYSKKKSIEIIETVLEIMKRSLEDGEDILISGFGKFCVKEKKEREGRNPSTGESMTLDKRRVVTFQCSGTLKKKINSK
jgi:integration host factor subunit alpha